ncbi:MAG TPA: hypothetical protein VGZ32_10315 [Actinocrinis sp.]|jgi:hypothetical protein|uniref:hypothetical protein n=1 Tax=Actinocrinis sp. TaxID=1920516 RepID=UPI002DDD1081|nr:hypothetical protein [Actinocrinis sp.]HEV3170724.1 hypothetical protein [Actinocrinis sp.]
MLLLQWRRRPTDRPGRHTGLLAAAALPATAAAVPTAAAFPSPTAVARALTLPGPASARVRAYGAKHGFLDTVFLDTVQDPARRSRVDRTAGALTAETVSTVGG